MSEEEVQARTKRGRLGRTVAIVAVLLGLVVAVAWKPLNTRYHRKARLNAIAEYLQIIDGDSTKEEARIARHQGILIDRGVLVEDIYVFNSSRGHAVFTMTAVKFIQHILTTVGRDCAYYELELGMLRFWCPPDLKQKVLDACRDWEQGHVPDMTISAEVVGILSCYRNDEDGVVDRIAEEILDDGVIEVDEQKALDFWFWSAEWIDEKRKAHLRTKLKKAKQVIIPRKEALLRYRERIHTAGLEEDQPTEFT